MLINKERIIESLKTEIKSKRKAEFPVNCKRWDKRLDLSRGATKRYIETAAETLGYNANTRSTLVKLKRRKSH
ncbi:MAG: hypothetical protein WBO10_14120 [Pyrinomonadaceae bacterium]